MIDKNKINILAVDDRPQNLLVLEQYLDSPSVNIVKAESGNQALGLVLDHTFALILLDVQMPEMNGFETAELIRQNKNSKEIPIIFLTAISKEEKYVFKGYQSGAVDYLIKPFDPDILKSKVNIFIQLYEQKIKLEILNTELENRVDLRTEELKVAKEKAEQANIAKSKFLSNISHELLTPLHCIVNFASFGLKMAKNMENKKILHYFSSITECSNDLLFLIQDLLNLVQLQAGQIIFTMAKTNVEESVHMVFDTLKQHISQNSITVHIQNPTVDTVAWCDREHTTKLFMQIISNAIKYSSKNGIIEVSFAEGQIVSGEKTVEALEISVKDQGIGIPEDELVSIFDAFRESSVTASKAGGKGLGLSICLEIVKAHHGKIWAENVEQGSVFKVLLPYNPIVD